MIDIDFETRSRVDIKMGPWRYASDPSTQIMCMAYKIGSRPTLIWTPGDPMPAFVQKRMWDVLGIRAHNAMFERAVWSEICVKRFGWPEIDESQWSCSAAKCAAHSLPRDLQRACMVMNTEVQKDMSGKRVMLKLSKPRKETKNNAKQWHYDIDVPEDFETLYKYCMMDVESEYSLDHAVRDLSAKEQQIWQLDQTINARGICVDTKAVRGAIEIIDAYEKQASPKLARLSDGAFNKVSQVAAIRRWMAEKGWDTESLDKEAVEALLSVKELPSEIREVLHIRQSLGKTSTKKLYAMLNAICPDGRVKDLLMYHGASTGRWSGKNIQVQNFPRRKVEDLDAKMKLLGEGNLEKVQLLHGDPMDLISSCLRGMIVAAPGKRLYVADYAAIEARGVCWLAGQESTLQLFRDNKDVYRVMASTIYSKPLSQVDGGEKDGQERQLGKQAVLGCGYNMGPPKFQATCEKYKMQVDLPLAERAVSAYRETNDKVVSMWYEQERAAKTALRERKGVKCGYTKWGVVGKFLYCKLPSGRTLAYPKARLVHGDTPWGEKRAQVEYMGLNTSNQWVAIRTYGGKIVENITQAVCRDIMAEAMLRLEAAGYRILFTVHDEIICETDDNFGSIEEFIKLLTEVPSWAKGFPIKAEGWTGYRYRK